MSVEVLSIMRLYLLSCKYVIFVGFLTLLVKQLHWHSAVLVYIFGTFLAYVSNFGICRSSSLYYYYFVCYQL